MQKQTLKPFCDKCGDEIIGKGYKYMLPVWEEIEENDAYDGRVSVSHVLSDKELDICEKCRFEIALK